MCVCCVCVGRAYGADDFLPVMMYVLARSNLSTLQMDIEYMMELMDPSLTIGEGRVHKYRPGNSSSCGHVYYMADAVCVCLCV